MTDTLTVNQENQDLPQILPAVVFKTRVRDDFFLGLSFLNVNSYEYFGGKRVLIFSLPGAFTPTCSTYQLPGFEENHAEFKALGIKDIYCVSVNDSFVMNQWAKSQKIKKVKVIPDGSAEFTQQMRMAVFKDNLGFGIRSWRYAVIANNGTIEKWFIEPGKEHNCQSDPYGETSPENILNWLRENGKSKN